MTQERTDEIRAELRQKSRVELEELVLAYSMAHARVCEIAGHPPGEHDAGGHGHASEEEMRERIRGKSIEELVDLLARATVVAEVAKV